MRGNLSCLRIGRARATSCANNCGMTIRCSSENKACIGSKNKSHYYYTILSAGNRINNRCSKNSRLSFVLQTVSLELSARIGSSLISDYHFIRMMSISISKILMD